MAKKAAKKSAGCNCRDQVDEQLEEFNTQLARTWMLDSGPFIGVALSVETEKIDPKKRTKKKTVLCSFCPFCGKKAS